MTGSGTVSGFGRSFPDGKGKRTSLVTAQQSSGGEVLMAEGLTELLLRWGDGDLAAMDELMPLVYDELRRIARNYLRRERPNMGLQPTALVNEAYLRMVDQSLVKWQNRAHFYAI